MPADFPACPTPLPRSFYEHDPRQVARSLLGKLLVRRLAPASRDAAPVLLTGRIVEAEAYLGCLDPGAHAYRGQTPRNAVLFGPAGHAYVYFIYGNHYCANVSCQPAGQAGCVLLRALEPVHGIATMHALRNPNAAALDSTKLSMPQLRQLTSGPGRLTQALAITRSELNGCDLCDASSPLLICDDGRAISEDAIACSPRINVHAAPHDEWRYFLADNPFVSGPRRRR